MHRVGLSASAELLVNNCYAVNEMIQLQLQESYCLPLLTNAFPALIKLSMLLRFSN